jgi:hypothetical protein
MLHSLSHESDWSRRGDARVVVYVRGVETTDAGMPWPSAIQQAIEHVPTISRVPVEQLVVLHLDAFLRAVRVGFTQYSNDVLASDDLDRRITQQMDEALTLISVVTS